MKMISSLWIGIVAAGALLLSACATSTPSRTTVSLLAAANFRLRTPETAKQKEIFATLPSYKVERVIVNGRTFYVYKDEAKGMAMVGGEAEYQRYRAMAKEERESAGMQSAAMATHAETESWQGAAAADWWR